MILAIFFLLEPALAQGNKEVFNIVIENVLAIIGVMTAVAALMNISNGINQLTSGEPAFQSFTMSMLVSFVGCLGLLIFSRIFAVYQNVHLDAAISLNGGICGVSFICALINYLYSKKK